MSDTTRQHSLLDFALDQLAFNLFQPSSFLPAVLLGQVLVSIGAVDLPEITGLELMPAMVFHIDRTDLDVYSGIWGQVFTHV